jgi:hypothetical protein
MTKGKKAVTLSALEATKSAASLANMAEEFGRQEVAASSELVAQSADKSSMEMLVTFDSSILEAKKTDSDLMARSSQQGRYSDGK